MGMSLTFAWADVTNLILALLLLLGVALVWPGSRPTYRPTSSPQEPPHQKALVHVDTRMAVCPTVLGHPVPLGYRLWALYFGTGLIDRTETLDQGFPYVVTDRIPALPTEPGPTLADLVADRARDIVARARRQDREIWLLWSGGIDSTAACCALMTELRDEDLGRLVVCYGAKSRAEYPWFFETIVKRRLRRQKIKALSEALGGGHLTVTGELGDQLFGSVKVITEPLERLRRPWASELPVLLSEAMASRQRVDTMLHYIEPQVLRAPVPLPDLYELMWWLNFSLKWQAVTERLSISVGSERYAAVHGLVVHFYQTRAFQQWAMTNPGQRVGTTWTSHKWPLKDIILGATGDRAYAETKLKVPSLGGMLRHPYGFVGVASDHTGRVLTQRFDDVLMYRIGQPPDVEQDFNASREAPLWAPLLRRRRHGTE